MTRNVSPSILHPLSSSEHDFCSTGQAEFLFSLTGFAFVTIRVFRGSVFHPRTDTPSMTQPPCGRGDVGGHANPRVAAQPWARIRNALGVTNHADLLRPSTKNQERGTTPKASRTATPAQQQQGAQSAEQRNTRLGDDRELRHETIDITSSKIRYHRNSRNRKE